MRTPLLKQWIGIATQYGNRLPVKYYLFPAPHNGAVQLAQWDTLRVRPTPDRHP
ncbi:hypothetical protein GCM10023082_50770 [Streptomyces tremellae]|uniref:Uncharacterized protein n=1 Tax=Streptomyces tremellae TaxID=1124239 RepID=A0ABP7FVW1_9ACTN